MFVLTIRTDRPQAEIGIYDTQQIALKSWEAHRRLAETIHLELQALLVETALALEDLQGIVVFRGPGSFTGLRIGLSVANALADSLQIPIVGSEGTNFKAAGIEALEKGENHQSVMPLYDSDVHITLPKK